MKLFKILLVSSVASILATATYAAGESDTPKAKVEKCEENFVYDKEKKECVEEEKSTLNDADLLDNGRALAYAGRFEEAVRILSKIDNQQTPVVQNYLGFANRSAGNLDVGLGHYRAALSLDPDYTLARSYMGQALLKKGDRAGAVIQLTEIEKRVGTDAREYVMLATSIKQHAETGTIIY